MDKKHIVVQSFAKDIDFEKIKTLEKTHTYISDKLILDSINGVNVVAKDHHEVLKNKTGFSRILGELTGNSKIHQDMINENIIQGIIACTSWLQDHDRHFTRIDGRIYDLTTELENTQEQILKFYNQHTNLKHKVEELKESFDNFIKSSQEMFSKFEDRIKKLEINSILNEEISFLKSDMKYKDFDDISLKLFVFFDNLFSGEFGFYCSLNKNYKLDYLESEIRNYIKDRNGNNYLNEYLSFEKIFKSLNNLNSLEKEAIYYISNHQCQFLETKGIISESNALIKLCSNDDINIFKKDIKNNSIISEFTTYEDYIRNTIREFK